MSQIVESSVNDGAKLVSGTYGIILDILKSIDTLNFYRSWFGNDIFTNILGGCQNAAGNLFYSPTILTDVTTDMECFKSEIFGPVVAIKRFSSEKVS